MRRILFYTSKYIQIILILLVAVMLVYWVSYKTLSNALTQNYSSILNDGLNKIIMRLNSYVEMSSGMLGESNIRKLILTRDFNSRSYYEMYMAQQYLGRIPVTDNMLQNYYIISVNNNMFLSRGMISENRDQFFNDFYFCDDYTSENWFSMLMPQDPYALDIITILPTVSANTVFAPWRGVGGINVQDILHVVVRQKTNPNSTRTAAIVVFMLNQDEFIKQLAPFVKHANGFLLLTDSMGNDLINYNYTDNSSSYVMMSAENPELNYYVTVGIPKSYFITQLKPVTDSVMIIILVSSICAFGYSLLLAYRELNSYKSEILRLSGVRDDLMISKIFDGSTFTEIDFIQNRDRVSPAPGFSTAQNFRDFLLLGDCDRIKEFFSKISAYDGILGSSDVQQIYYLLRGILLYVANQSGIELTIPPIKAHQSMPSALDLLDEPCRIVCEFHRAKHGQETDRQSEKVMHFVGENICENEISVRMVSEQLKIPQKRVTAIIKQETGMTLSEYVEEQRFEKAKQLLRTDVPINSIPEAVGFNSVNTFYKAFKRITGMSPGEWRKINIVK